MKTQSSVIFATSEEISQLDGLRTQAQEIDGANKFLLAPMAGFFGYMAVSSAFDILEYEERYKRPMDGSRLSRTEAAIASACRLYTEFSYSLLECGGRNMSESIRDIASRFTPRASVTPELTAARAEASSFARAASEKVGISPEDLEKFKAAYAEKKGLAPAQELLKESGFVDKIMGLIKANLDGPATRNHVAAGTRRFRELAYDATLRTELLAQRAGTAEFACTLAAQQPELAALYETAQRAAATFDKQVEAEPLTQEIMTQAMEDLFE